MYNLNFDTLAGQLLPSILRKPKLKAFLEMLLFPLRYVNDALLEYIEETRLALSFNGQTIVLERALNLKYPAAADGIYIENDVTLLPKQFVFFEEENQPDNGFVYFQSEGMGDHGFAYFQSEYANEVDFLVMVPAALVFDEDEMKAFVNKYKIAGMRCAIQTY